MFFFLSLLFLQKNILEIIRTRETIISERRKTEYHFGLNSKRVSRRLTGAIHQSAYTIPIVMHGGGSIMD